MLESSSLSIHTVFTIIVVDLPPACNLVLGHEWSYPLGGYLMNARRCIMLPSKEGGLTKISLRDQESYLFLEERRRRNG